MRALARVHQLRVDFYAGGARTRRECLLVLARDDARHAEHSGLRVKGVTPALVHNNKTERRMLLAPGYLGSAGSMWLSHR